MTDYDWQDDAKGSYDLAIAKKREAHLLTIPGVKRARVIGGCELLQGDCLEIMPHLPKVGAVVTDPPYGNSNHDGDWNARLNAHRGLENKPIANDDADSMRVVVDAMLRAAVGILPKEASACACFCGGGGASAGVRMAGRAHGPRRAVVLSLGRVGQAEPRPRPAVSASA